MKSIFNSLFPTPPFKKKWHFIGTLATIPFSVFAFMSFWLRNPERFFVNICLLYVASGLILRVIRSKKLYDEDNI